MKANTDTRTESLTTPRAGWRLAALAAVGALTLAACTSDPGARRVAEDIIEGEFEQGAITEGEKDCMFEVLEDDYSEDDLERIASQLENADANTVSEGEAQLAQLRADLDACTA